ncbi:DGQHR domain-containing protein [Citrifermentans bremense]|uniref:DGQHR domain-containing protein n=1 Tax=Citrifermentans bremense TaxID=60035 RepID=UPI00040325B1|nr:DGQHR domain-containing protein [Citrifermentans bremense]
MSNFLELPAIKISQPLGIFYSVVIPANTLKLITYVARAKYKREGIFNKVLSPITGTQRDHDEKREKDIAAYIDSTESALPNTIILGANIEENGSLTRESDRWHAIEVGNGFYQLIVPTGRALASVIDGQHRLNGCVQSERQDYNLICSVYLDLPAPYHAYLFATINANQKKVDRSLAYDLYGFSLDQEPRTIWSPEKLAVYLVRKINVSDGPFKNRIILGAQSDEESDNGLISLAALVDSILNLVSSNPKQDRDKILYHKNDKGRKSLIVKKYSPPLRELYITGQDDKIEFILLDFIAVANEIVLKGQPDRSYIVKTVGIQAILDWFKCYLQIKGHDFDRGDLLDKLHRINRIDFTDNFYTASGLGRGRMKNVMLINTGLKALDSLRKSKDFEFYGQRQLAPAGSVM